MVAPWVPLIGSFQVAGSPAHMRARSPGDLGRVTCRFWGPLWLCPLRELLFPPWLLWLPVALWALMLEGRWFPTRGFAPLCGASCSQVECLTKGNLPGATAFLQVWTPVQSLSASGCAWYLPVVGACTCPGDVDGVLD